MVHHNYNVLWSNKQFSLFAKEYKYRQIVLEGGMLVLDRISSIWSIDSRVASNLFKSWNCHYGVTKYIPVDIQYIYFLI